MNLLDLQSDPAAFRESLLIDTDSGPQPFSEVIDDWQAADFRELDSGWQRAVIGSSAEATYQRGWLERPRGHSKSLDIGIQSAWALFASRRPLSGIAAASDRDQARLIRDAIGRLVFCNPWLGKILEVQNTRVINTATNSTLEIISSDAPSSYGLTPDFIICDELVHWQKRDLWDSLLSSSAKRKTCMLVIITNAGLSDDWQWKTREVIRNDPSWYFSRLDGPKASWITEEILAEQQRLLPDIAYRRLWLNQWTSGSSDFCSEEDLAAAFHSNLRPQEQALPGFTYVAGLDLGVSRDASAVCVLGVNREPGESHGRIRLAYTKVWKPTKNSKVNLQEVEDTILALHDRFDFEQLNFDPWNAHHLASRLQSGGLGTLDRGIYRQNRKVAVPMVEIPFTGSNLQRMATTLIELLNDRRLEAYDDADLKRDLRRARIQEKATYGFRIEFPRDNTGHGDLGTSFMLAALAASEIASTIVHKVGAIDLNENQEDYELQRTRQAWRLALESRDESNQIFF